MPFNFQEHPGHLFVVATLLPLASFVLILLAGAVWAALRPYQRNATVRPLFEMFGGEDEDRPGRGRCSSWTATAAIAIAFVFCLSGAVKYLGDHEEDEKQKQALETKIAELHKQLLKSAGDEKEVEEHREALEKTEKELLTIESKMGRPLGLALDFSRNRGRSR